MEISILLKKGYSRRDIARAMGRDHTVIGREIRRNIANGAYEPVMANNKARNRRKRSKYQGMKIRGKPELERYVKERLRAGWAPEVIAGRLKTRDTHLPYVSAKGIYKWLYSCFGQAYCPYLFTHRYKPKKKKGRKAKRGMIPNRVGIENRPEAINKRLEYGHYEGDTIVSGKRHKSKTALSVITERKSKYTGLRKVKNLKPETNSRAIRKMTENLCRKTFTFGNGLENRAHEKLAEQLTIDIYFCDPYSSWQKGGVENVNGIIRRFIPKGADIADCSDARIRQIEFYLNHTPRKCLNFKTPHEVMVENNLFLKKINPGGAFEG